MQSHPVQSQLSSKPRTMALHTQVPFFLFALPCPTDSSCFSSEALPCSARTPTHCTTVRELVPQQNVMVITLWISFPSVLQFFTSVQCMTENIRHAFAASILSSFMAVYNRMAGSELDTIRTGSGNHIIKRLLENYSRASSVFPRASCSPIISPWVSLEALPVPFHNTWWSCLQFF